MQQAIRTGLLLLVVIVLAACDTANDGSAGGDNRLRLDTRNAEAEFGEFVVRVSAQLTSDLTPEVAQSYGIVRSDTRGFANLVLLRKQADGSEKPVAAKVTASVANLNGQLKNAPLQEVKSGDSVYYVVELDVTDREVINFDFDIRPIDSNRLLQVRYTHEFYAR